ncbi:HRDC domain-containing protein [Gemmobacter lanyuensis]
MARISGIGAKKLESYGAAFLAVITGATENLHPQRLRLAGQPAADIFDRLAEAQLRLMRGEDGIEKPLSLSQSVLRRIAEARPTTLADLDRVGDLGAAKLERFGTAFLAICRGD